jgi:hypothetical protein
VIRLSSSYDLKNARTPITIAAAITSAIVGIQSARVFNPSRPFALELYAAPQELYATPTVPPVLFSPQLFVEVTCPDCTLESTVAPTPIVTAMNTNAIAAGARSLSPMPFFDLMFMSGRRPVLR